MGDIVSQSLSLLQKSSFYFQGKEIKPWSLGTTTTGRKAPRLTGVNHIV